MPAPEASGLAVLRLKLSDFRGYADTRIEVDRRSVVLTGSNGAGKTNVLEALSMLAPGRGLRRARLSDLDRQGGGAWAIAARLQRGAEEPVEVGTGRDPEGGDKRVVRIDAKPVRGQAQLAEIVRWLGAHVPNAYGADDGLLRHVSKSFVDIIVDAFLNAYCLPD